MGNSLEEMAAFGPRVRNLAARTWTLLVDVYPEVVEVPWAKQNMAGHGVGPKKMVELAGLCAVAFVDQLFGRGRAWMSSNDRVQEMISGRLYDKDRHSA